MTQCHLQQPLVAADLQPCHHAALLPTATLVDYALRSALLASSKQRPCLGGCLQGTPSSRQYPAGSVKGAGCGCYLQQLLVVQLDPREGQQDVGQLLRTKVPNAGRPDLVPLLVLCPCRRPSCQRHQPAQGSSTSSKLPAVLVSKLRACRAKVVWACGRQPRTHSGTCAVGQRCR